MAVLNAHVLSPECWRDYIRPFCTPRANSPPIRAFAGGERTNSPDIPLY
jgi:hypothetical protein